MVIKLLVMPKCYLMCGHIMNISFISHKVIGEHGGSVVEHQTPEPCCVLEQITLLPKSTGNTQEAMALSRHD